MSCCSLLSIVLYWNLCLELPLWSIPYIVMSCYHPLVGIPDYDPITNKPYLTKNGKTKYRIIKTENYDRESLLKFEDMILIPCGKCIGCRLEYSRQWANRLMLELQYHDSAYFVTLTYNPGHVPKAYYADPETGEAKESLTLCKRDVQLFIKRLRKAFPNDHIRYYYCGEYGTQTFRPHYHMIIFGLHLTDGYPWRWNREDGRNFVYYRSPSLERCWSKKCEESTTPLTQMSKVGNLYEPIGNVEYSEVTWDTCAYTARYVTKKLNGPEGEFYKTFNLVSPFSDMSRKPGIGRQYYEDHPDMLDSEYVNISTDRGGRKFRPPRYYEKIFELDHPDEAEQRKDVRKAMAKAALALKLDQTDRPYSEILAASEDIKEKRTKILKRSGI